MLPAFALYTPWLVGDSDSARLVASIQYVQRGGPRLPRAVPGGSASSPPVWVRPSPSAVSPGRANPECADARLPRWRRRLPRLADNRSPLGVLARRARAELASGDPGSGLPPPMYSAMLAFGFLGVFLAHRAIAAETRAGRWQNAVLSALCLVLSFEAHQVGQLFLVLTALLAMTARPSSTLAGLGRVGLVVAVLSIPRLTINMLEGGFYRLSATASTSGREGLHPVNSGASLTSPPVTALGEYLAKVPAGLFGVWGASGLLALVLGLVGLGLASPRLRRLALAFTFVMLAVAVHRRLPFYRATTRSYWWAARLRLESGSPVCFSARWRAPPVRRRSRACRPTGERDFDLPQHHREPRGSKRAIASAPYSASGHDPSRRRASSVPGPST